MTPTHQGAERTLRWRRPRSTFQAPVAMILLGVFLALVTSVAVIRLPQSQLPAAVVVGVLISLFVFSIPTSTFVRVLPLAIGLMPATVLLAVQIIGGQGALVALGVLLLLTCRSMGLHVKASAGAPEAAMGFFALALVVGAIHGGGPGASRLLVVTITPFFLAWLLGKRVAAWQGSASALWWSGVLFVSASAPIGVLEAVTGSDMVIYPGTDLISISNTSVVRPNGFMASDIDFALTMTLAVALVLGGPAPTRRGRRLAVPIALLGSVAIILASFRTGWIVLGAVWLMWLFKKGAGAWVLALGVAAAAAPIALNFAQHAGQNQYVQTRILNQSNVGARSQALNSAWEIFLGHPVLGVGINAYVINPLVLSGPYGADRSHNIWLNTLAELGLVGGLALLAVAIAHVASATRIARIRPSRVGASGAVWAAAAFLGFSMTFQVLSLPMSMTLAGIILGSIRGLAYLPACPSYE